MHKNKLVAGLVIVAAMSPALVFAQSTDVQSQVQALLAQIQSLQQQLRTLVASSSGEHGSMNGSSTQPWMNGSTTPPWNNGTSTPPRMPPGQVGKMMCITLNRNLRAGSQGDDVRQLQVLLGQDADDGFTASSTGFFGPLTAHAMAKFQMQMGIASSTNGSVGPLTRGFFERQCGQGLGNGPGMGEMMGSNGEGHQGPPPGGPNASSTAPVAQPGAHCGGFIVNAAMCTPGYHCQLSGTPDTGGTCMANASSTP